MLRVGGSVLKILGVKGLRVCGFRVYKRKFLNILEYIFGISTKIGSFEFELVSFVFKFWVYCEG